MKHVTSFDFDQASSVLKDYKSFNGFYNLSDMRQRIYDLYGGICAISQEPVSMEDGEVGHIVPQSRASYFEELYPDLDVHNAINLHWIKGTLNRRNSNNVNPSPLAIHDQIMYAASLVKNKAHILLKQNKKQSFMSSSFVSALPGETPEITEKDIDKTVWFLPNPYQDLRFYEGEIPASDNLLSLIDKIEDSTFPIVLTEGENLALIYLGQFSIVGLQPHNYNSRLLSCISQCHEALRFVNYSVATRSIVEEMARGTPLEAIVVRTDQCKSALDISVSGGGLDHLSLLFE